MDEFFCFFLNFLFFILIHFFKVLHNIDLHILEYINHNRIKSFDYFFITLTNSATIITYLIPVLILTYAIIKRRLVLQRKGWLILISLVINSMIIDIIKNIVNRQRPFIGNDIIEKLTKAGSPSFPSGHAGEVFLLATSVSLLFAGQKWAILAAWIWAILVSYSRLVLGVHYPSDVTASMILSSCIAIVVNKFLIKRDFLEVSHS